jgi:hypothetical protein
MLPITFVIVPSGPKSSVERKAIVFGSRDESLKLSVDTLRFLAGLGVLGTMERRVRLSLSHDATLHSLATVNVGTGLRRSHLMRDAKTGQA